MATFENLTLSGRLYVPLLVLDGQQRICEVRVPDTTRPPRNSRTVQPYICTDCNAITVDPADHQVQHDGPTCRVCGCTNDRACDLGVQDGGNWTELATCHWVERDLCSNPECVAAASRDEAAVVDLVAALRQSIEAAKARREEQGRG